MTSFHTQLPAYIVPVLAKLTVWLAIAFSLHISSSISLIRCPPPLSVISTGSSCLSSYIPPPISSWIYLFRSKFITSPPFFFLFPMTSTSNAYG